MFVYVCVFPRSKIDAYFEVNGCQIRDIETHTCMNCICSQNDWSRFLGQYWQIALKDEGGFPSL